MERYIKQTKIRSLAIRPFATHTADVRASGALEVEVLTGLLLEDGEADPVVVHQLVGALGVPPVVEYLKVLPLGCNPTREARSLDR